MILQARVRDKSGSLTRQLTVHRSNRAGFTVSIICTIWTPCVRHFPPPKAPPSASASSSRAESGLPTARRTSGPRACNVSGRPESRSPQRVVRPTDVRNDLRRRQSERAQGGGGGVYRQDAANGTRSQHAFLMAITLRNRSAACKEMCNFDGLRGDPVDGRTDGRVDAETDGRAGGR